MSLYQAFNRDRERGYVPQRKSIQAYQTLAEEAKAFEYTKTIPKKLQELEQRIENIEISIALMRQTKDNDPVKAYLEPITSRMAQIEARIGLERHNKKQQGDMPNIIVPEELMVLTGKYGKCTNRKYEIVKRRWALWKAQYDAGIPMTTIARAWKCDHGSISYARKNNWVVSRGWGRNKRANK